MEYIQFGQTDLHVSRLAFGTWSFGGEWGPVQVDDGKAAIRKALDLGINFFDTARRCDVRSRDTATTSS
jgi:aryl-alcohol dehydrogenase-like predicted oxidoreductase